MEPRAQHSFSPAEFPAQGAPDPLPLVYSELRRLAAAHLSREKPGQTLQATALVHEAWLRLDGSTNRDLKDPGEFMAYAAEAMRRILVENARRKRRPKHGGDLQRLDVNEVPIACPVPEDELLAVDAALDRLAELDPRAALVVKLRFFVGLTEAQVAEHLGLSGSTVSRTWAFARAWLFDEIKDSPR